MIRITAGGCLVDGLAVDHEPSEFNMRLLRRCLEVAGDPEGRETYAVDIGEGRADVFQFAVPHQSNADGSDMLRLRIEVDYISGDVLGRTECWQGEAIP